MTREWMQTLVVFAFILAPGALVLTDLVLRLKVKRRHWAGWSFFWVEVVAYALWIVGLFAGIPSLVIAAPIAIVVTIAWMTTKEVKRRLQDHTLR